MGRDELHIFCWVASIVFAVGVGVWRWRRLHWVVLGSVLLFAALNASAGIYVLSHFGDPRWSAGGEPPLSAVSLSGVPVVGESLGPLESVLNGAVDGVNEFWALTQALSVAMEFLGVSGLALVVSCPLAILAVCISAVISYFAAKRRKADLETYRATVDLLKEELEQIKRQIASGNSAGTALAAADKVTDVQPGLVPRG